ncbi:hypothetical protein [Serratia fonticola]|uniref:hypothetical protein n=1 Tax=Serratia fonticola TaxID=47917 RepID=UPI000E2E226C|nr:hypothetical protein [Serratia fonticola]RDL15184.1 hypothetical protein DFO62_12667 [Serratia fonticola]
MSVYKKTITPFLAIIISSSVSFSALSAEATSKNITVQSIKADWPKDIKPTQYYYKFGADVCNNKWILVGDENINTVLRLAYILNSTVDIGVNSCNTITTVYFN